MTERTRSRATSCTGKTRYAAKADAKSRARNLEAVDGQPHSAYECPWCGAWHVGRTRKSARAREVVGTVPPPTKVRAGNKARHKRQDPTIPQRERNKRKRAVRRMKLADRKRPAVVLATARAKREWS